MSWIRTSSLALVTLVFTLAACGANAPAPLPAAAPPVPSVSPPADAFIEIVYNELTQKKEPAPKKK